MAVSQLRHPPDIIRYLPTYRRRKQALLEYVNQNTYAHTERVKVRV